MSENDDNIPAWVLTQYHKKLSDLKKLLDSGGNLSDKELQILNSNPSEFWTLVYDRDPTDVTILDSSIKYTINYYSNVDRKIQILFEIKKNQIEMMKIRGYDTTSEDFILNMTDIDFQNYLFSVNQKYVNGSQSNITTLWGEYIYPHLNFKDKEIQYIMNLPRAHLSSYYHSNNGESCAVFYIDRPGPESLRITKELIEIIVGYLIGTDTKNVILISTKNLGSHAKKVLNQIPSIINENRISVPRGFWVFLDNELFINPILHNLSPKFKILSEVESREFRRTYKHPPLISVEDPMIKFYGWDVGRVVEILRDISDIDAMSKLMVSKRLIVRDNLVGIRS